VNKLSLFIGIFFQSLIPALKHGARRTVVKLSSAFIIFILAQPAQALIINTTYDSSVTSLGNAAQVEAAFGVAAQMFQGQYTNAVTINITVYWGATGPFGGGIDLGASRTHYRGNPTYIQVTNALRAARSSTADSNAVASLPASDPGSPAPWWIPRAEGKVLGTNAALLGGFGVAPNDTNSDGEIGFASDVTYTFDPTNRAVSGKYDFIGVAEHEISEVLGRSFDLNYNPGGYVPYDLFRFTNGVRNFSINGTNVYFSINNGLTALKFFYTNVNIGDIQDWQSSTPPDACDAFVSSGNQLIFSTNDVIALDILGYNTPPITSPRLTGKRLTGGTFQITFTNVPNTGFTVLTATNLSLPLANWTVLGAAIEGPPGQFLFNDSQAVTNKLRFYRVRSP
jgi:hypothetical protein